MQDTLFAIPASKALLAKTREVLQRAPDASIDVMREVVIEAGRHYVDSVVDGFIMAFLRDGMTTALTHALLVNLASVIKAVCRVAIQQAAKTSGQAELEAITRFFETRVAMTVRDGQKVGLIVYPLDEVLHARVRRAAEAREDTPRDVYVRALSGVLEESVARHYDDAFGLLSLGFVARRAVSLGRSAVLAAGHAAIRVSVAQDEAEDLRALSQALRAHLVPASMCRPA